MPSPRPDLEALVEKVIPQAVEFRRLLHRHPEPSYEEHQTTALIASEWARWGEKQGPVTGSADGFTLTLTGPGGHTSRPHKTVDLVAAAARVVSQLPEAIHRTVDSRIPVVTVFGSIRGGDAANVIPSEVELAGTVRTLDRSLWEVLPGLVDKAIGSLTTLSGADYSLDYRQGIPPVVNDHAVVEAVSNGIAEEVGPETVVDVETSMGSEDFANYLDAVPGALLRLGTHSGGGDLHSASFRINEASIGVGIRAGTAALLGMLDRL